MTVYGIWNSSFRQSFTEYEEEDSDDWHYVLHRLEGGGLAPEQLVTHRFALEDLEEGLAMMRDKAEDYCKVMMTQE